MNKDTMLLYFPYGLRVMLLPHYKESLLIVRMNQFTYEAVDFWGRKFEIPYEAKNYKPILYPISHIGLPIKVNSTEIVALDLICRTLYDEVGIVNSSNDSSWLENCILEYFKGSLMCPFPRDIMNHIYRILYSLHFDLSGSLKKREAKNVLKLTYNPYQFDKVNLF